MCSPIERGGLGIRSVVSFNQALLENWLWKYGHEVTHLSPQNMMRVRWGGALKSAGGLMGVVSGEALMKGGRAFLSICPL